MGKIRIELENNKYLYAANCTDINDVEYALSIVEGLKKDYKHNIQLLEIEVGLLKRKIYFMTEIHFRSLVMGAGL